jgi:hypothetical protein
MAGLFKRRKREMPNIEPENRPEQRLGLLYAERVPASARSPELERLMSLPDEDADPDAPDEDLEFLASLAREVERTPIELPRVQPAPRIETVVIAPTEEEKLNVFRQTRDEDERVRTSQTLGVPNADLDDVLEDLATTVAALRRRRAA